MLSVGSDERRRMFDTKTADNENADDKGPIDSLQSQALDLSSSPDIYDACVVAAFGGVRLQASGKIMRIHPFPLLLASMALFVIQLTALMCLRVDTNVTIAIYKSQSDVLLRMKLLMIIVLQLMNFKELASTIKMFVFVINPATWVDFDRPDPFDQNSKSPFKLCFHPSATCPCAVVSLMFKFGIAFIVNMDSISVILKSSSVEECIFNSLAITFITDLDEAFWLVCQTIFNLGSFDEFKFTYATGDRRRSFIEHSFFGCLLPCVANRTRRHEKMGWTRLAVMSVLYARVFSNILFAYHTNVLPVARDLCLINRWWFGQTGWNRLSYIVMSIFDFFVAFPIEPELERVVKTMDGNCTEGGRYDRMLTTDVIDMFEIYPHTYIICLSLLLVLLCLPPCLSNVATQSGGALKKYLPAAIGPEDFLEDDDEGEGRTLEMELLHVKQRLEKLEAATAQRRWQLQCF